MGKSCLDCSNYVGKYDVAKQKSIYGEATPGMATCPARGLILDAPGLSSDGIKELHGRAESCGSYNKQPRSVRLALTVGIPNPADTYEPELVSNSRIPAGSCEMCFFCIPHDAVEEETSISMNLCAKYGKLVPRAKSKQVSLHCSSSTSLHNTQAIPDNPDSEEDIQKSLKRHNAKLASSVLADPQLTGFNLFGFLGMTGPGAESGEAHDFVEPSEWPTDAKVTDSHKKMGIKSWRKLFSPDRKRSTLIPVFDSEFFSESQRALIPKTGSDEHPELYRDHGGIAYKAAVLWREMDETPSVVGPPGVGKTELFRHMAWMMQLPFERVSITRRSELDDLAGKIGYTPDKGTHFQHGRIPQAWSKPCVIVIDEPNVGPPEVWQFLRPLTDNSKQLVLDMNEGEVVKRNENCYFGMAMNPAWDSRNIGANEISDADGRRLMHIWMSTPPVGEERRIIRERCKEDGFSVENNQLSALMGIAKRLRRMSDDGVIPISWGLANQIKTARALAWFDFPDAFRLAVVDHLDPESADLILDVVREYMV